MFKKNIKLFGLPLFLFFLLVISIVFLGLEIKKSTSKYLDEIEPIEDALESKRIDLYSDSVLLYKYLSIDDMSRVLTLDEEIEESNHKCVMIDTRISTLYSEGLVREELYTSYELALEDHSKSENLKDEMIMSHRAYLVGNKSIDVSYDLIVEYEMHFSNAIVKIDSQLSFISDEKQRVESRIELIEYTMFSLLFILSLLFLFFSMKSFNTINRDIMGPLESIDKKTQAFTKGDFSTTISTKSSKEDVKELESRMNQMFSYIRDFTKKPSQKREFKERFLKNEYHEILDLLKNRKNGSKATTMKDIKIALRITHPTLISRLNYLKEHSYVSIEKNGRDKIVRIID